jgi:predicted nucleotidyltransferase
MKDQENLLQEIVNRVHAQGIVDRVVLFGSRARGEARPNSDYDILVIKDSPEPRHRRSIPYYEAVADLPVEVEIMVYTPEEVIDWSQVPEAFVTTALREGKVLYERKV